MNKGVSKQSGAVHKELGRDWPHLDRYPGCPPALAGASRKVVVGNSAS